MWMDTMLLKITNHSKAGPQNNSLTEIEKKKKKKLEITMSSTSYIYNRALTLHASFSITIWACLFSCSPSMPENPYFKKKTWQQMCQTFPASPRWQLYKPAICFPKPHWRNLAVGQHPGKPPCGVIMPPQGNTRWDLQDSEWQWQLHWVLDSVLDTSCVKCEQAPSYSLPPWERLLPLTII